MEHADTENHLGRDKLDQAAIFAIFAMSSECVHYVI